MKFHFIKVLFSIFIINNFLSSQSFQEFTPFDATASVPVYTRNSPNSHQNLSMNGKGNAIYASRSEYQPYRVVVSLFDSTSNSWSTPTGVHTNAAGKSQSSYSVSMSENNEKILYTKKTVTQDPIDKDIEWVELDLYDFLKDQDTKDKTIH